MKITCKCLIVIILVCFFSSCRNTSTKNESEKLKINRNNSSYPIVLRLNYEGKKKSLIELPIEFEIKNSSSVSNNLLASFYISRNTYYPSHSLYYLNSKNILTLRKKQMIETPINANSTKKFVLYTKHVLDSTELQIVLKKSNIILKSQEDSIVLNKTDYFKMDHPFLTKLTKNDTVKLAFGDLNQKEKINKKIIFSVN